MDELNDELKQIEKELASKNQEIDLLMETLNNCKNENNELNNKFNEIKDKCIERDLIELENEYISKRLQSIMYMSEIREKRRNKCFFNNNNVSTHDESKCNRENTLASEIRCLDDGRKKQEINDGRSAVKDASDSKETAKINNGNNEVSDNCGRVEGKTEDVCDEMNDKQENNTEKETSNCESNTVPEVKGS